MKYLLIVALICTSACVTHAQLPAKKPNKISITADFRDLLLTNKWSWRNVSAGVPDRECVFMPDGTFRHPNFTASFTVKDIKTVELSRKKDGKTERAVMTFNPDYMSFEVLDFDKARRITGQRLSK
jgi:hypothetical protein